MKKKLLTIGLSLISLLVVAQKNDKGLISKIPEFKNRLYLSTSKDPLALMKAKTINIKELEANELVAKTSPASKLKSGEAEGAYIDTTHTYPWNPETQAWDTVPTTRIIKSFDEQHNLVHYRDLLWNGESWTDNVQFFYTYNEANQVVDVIQQAWQFDGHESYNWVNIDRAVYQYNELGQQNSYTYHNLSYETNDWELSWKQEFYYDDRGNNIEIIESYWDLGMSTWTPGLNVLNEYDSNNNLIENPILYWDYSTNNWTNAYKYIYEYNSLNNNISMIIQVWNADIKDWDNYLQKKSSYNDNNKIDSYTVQMWDSFLSEWLSSQRAVYQYDNLGNNVSILGEEYDASNDTWNTRWVNYFDYNEQNKQISNSSLYYDANVGHWIFGSKTKAAKIATSQKSETVNAETLKVFPNPASGWVNIENSNKISQIELFNSLGKKVLAKNNIDETSVHLDVAHLSTGVYFLIIKDSSGKSESKRFVIN